ncbi:DUF3667 domain-containing protein [Litorilituus lipolyticus]|uniref:DUF3667 domain-containing protein n=1 Tax=Litorilituus lipolyticus TaxID=2491017 RepID=A0A502KNW2_9GAMM|nr:DUF3667 domain-containing protein [Litorilituus lipolyticus]
MNCKNCHSKLIKGGHYCIHCGQNSTSLNRPFGSVSKEFLHELLDIDGRLSLTLITMVKKPGQLTHEFNQGKRVKYTPPLRLYLAISILFFIIFSSIYQVYAPERPLTDSMISYYSKAMFLLFPIFALIVQLFFRQSFYIGNLVFSMHLHSIVYIILMFIAPLEALEQEHQIFLLLQLPLTLYLVWYIFKAFKTVYQDSWLKTIVKASVIYMVYMSILGLVFDVLMKNFF